MHDIEFIRLIEESAQSLGIEVQHFADNWAMKLSKGENTHFIVGYTLPLNSAVSMKIVRNKNVCNEILTSAGVPNVPHQLIYTPAMLLTLGRTNGNRELINEFISSGGFPLLVKRNDSSRGEGVCLVHNETELERALNRFYAGDRTICLSPYREITHEYRNIVLDNRCLLTYEKERPFVVGDGTRKLIQLIGAFVGDNHKSAGSRDIFDESLLDELNNVPAKGERVVLHWRHNASIGTSYRLVNDRETEKIALRAVSAVNARFVSVDVISSEEHGAEVIEINSSVVMSAFSASSMSHHSEALRVYSGALQAVFDFEKTAGL